MVSVDQENNTDPELKQGGIQAHPRVGQPARHTVWQTEELSLPRIQFLEKATDSSRNIILESKLYIWVKRKSTLYRFINSMQGHCSCEISILQQYTTLQTNIILMNVLLAVWKTNTTHKLDRICYKHRTDNTSAKGGLNKKQLFNNIQKHKLKFLGASSNRKECSGTYWREGRSVKEAGEDQEPHGQTTSDKGWTGKGRADTSGNPW